MEGAEGQIGFVAPEGYVVEGYAFVDGVAVDRRSELSVAQRKGFFEAGGGTVIVKFEVRARVGVARLYKK